MTHTSTTDHKTLPFDTVAAKKTQADTTLSASISAPITFPMDQVMGQPSAAKMRRLQRIREELLAGQYEQPDVLDRVVDRLWADIQAMDTAGTSQR